MKLRNIEIIIAICAALTIAIIIYFTNPYPALKSAYLRFLLIAGILHIVSLFLWSAVWAYILKKGESTVSYKKALTVSIASLTGILTPMNIGTDFLRSFYGKQRSGLSYQLTAAASILTRTFKMHVTLFLLVFMAVSTTFFARNLIKTVIVPIAAIVFLLLALYSLRTNSLRRLTNRLKIGEISEPIRKMNLSLNLVEKGLIYLVFAAGFAFEWLSLHLCFLALNLKASLSYTFIFFIVMYFLSRTPAIPQGLGVVEVSGYGLLKTMNVATAQMGALLVVWDFMRIFVPIVLAFVFSLELKRLHHFWSKRFKCDKADYPTEKKLQHSGL